jgi:hypothetical protein
MQLYRMFQNLYRGHTQRFELSKCIKTHRGLPRIVMVVKLFLKHPVYRTWVLAVSRTVKLDLTKVRNQARPLMYSEEKLYFEPI